jgi:hypothetical protein
VDQVSILEKSLNDSVTSVCHISCLKKNGDLTILHLFSIETANEPCIAHIINQTMIKFRYGIVEITGYLYFTIDHFENFKILCIRVGDLTTLYAVILSLTADPLTDVLFFVSKT